MNNKFLIFVAVSVFLVVAIYSSTFTVYAKECRSAANGVDRICWENNNGKITNVQYCYDIKLENATVERCINVGNARVIVPSINEALDIIRKGTQDITKAPNTNLPPGNNLPPLISDDNNTKVPKVPEDLGGLNDLPKLSPGD